MAGGGKAGKGKAKKKTELEEKLEAAQQEEMRRELALKAREELRKRLKKEEEISVVNRNKIMNHWRNIMRATKTKDLKNEIRVLSQDHERNIDRKDAIIQMIDCDLEESEEQFQMVLRNHLRNIDRILEEHDTMMIGAERKFREDLNVLQSEFEGEKERIEKRHGEEVGELRSVVKTIEEEEERRNHASVMNHEQMREEIKNKSLEDINMLRIALDGQIEELEHHFESAHLNYLQQTNQRTRDFKELTKSDQKLSREIEIKRRMVDRLQNNIQHWKTKIRQMQRENEERNRLLLEEKQTIQKHYQQLKRRIQNYKKDEDKQVLDLTKHAENHEGKLKNVVEMMERILENGELTRKMETEQEQILPFQETEGGLDNVEGVTAVLTDSNTKNEEAGEETKSYQSSSF